MKLLITTQTVDLDDPVLGFFHRWIEAFAGHYDRITVICLKEGRHDLPGNVRVFSLGKKDRSRRGPIRRAFDRIRHASAFLALAWRLRRDYHAVFVHMNEEHILLAGPLWRLLGRKAYLWRNHYAGSWLTDLAAVFCAKVFCTSRHSYTAKYPTKTVLMPVGVDTERFHAGEAILQKKDSILFLARMAPSKDPLMLLEALRELSERKVAFAATVVGSPLPEHEAYYRSLVAYAERSGLSDRVSFVAGVPNHETPDLYRAHEVFVNCSPSGMFDKTLFEATVAGCFAIARSEDFTEAFGEGYGFDGTAHGLAARIQDVLALDPAERARKLASARALIEREHALPVLAERIAAVIHSPEQEAERDDRERTLSPEKP